MSAAAAAARFVFGLSGNVNGLLLFLAPMITFTRIICSKSTEEFSGIPYVATLLNCLVTGWYGTPFVSPDNYLVSILNAAGATLESIYVLIFIILAPKPEKAKILGILAFVLSVFGAVVLISLVVFDGESRKLFCGLAATMSAIAMYASPLSVMRMVIKTKSVEFMPFFLSLLVFLCGTSWFAYGLLGDDPFIAVPNGLGSGLGAMQLMLYAIYRHNTGETYKFSFDGSLEMRLSKAHREKQSNLKPSPNI